MIEFIKHINFFEWLKFYKTSVKDDFNKNYRQVEYLQSDGNQYIITPFYYDEGDVGTVPIYNIKCRCCINDNYSIFGIYRAFNLTGSSGKMRFYGYNDRQNLITDITIGTELNNWELLNKNLYCNGIIQNSTPDYFNNVYGFGGGNNIYLFGRAGLDDNGGICKISNFYVSAKNPDTGTITEICDLVACIRKSDNKPGMYDKVSQTFLTNQGTGEFKTPIYGYLSGNPPFTFNSNGNPLVDYAISGNTIQSTTPTPDSSVMPQGTGERTGNLFDGVIYEGFYNDNGQLVIDTSHACHTNLIKADTQTTYTVSNLWQTAPNFAVYEWDANKQWLRRTNRQTPPSDKKITFTLSNDCVYFSLQISSNYDYTRLMLNTGSTALPYEPHGYKIPISSAGQTTPVYLGVTEATRKVKKLVFDGTEDWMMNADGWFYLALVSDDYLRSEGNITSTCSHYPTYKQSSAIAQLPDDYTGFSWGSAQRLYLKDTSHRNDLSSFKQWVASQYAAGTPVTVWYVLATEETGIVNEPLMKIGDYADTVSYEQTGVEIPTINGSNTLTVDTTLQPSEVSIVYKK